MNHVSPHFSLCAPAYGTVGTKLNEALNSEITNSNLSEKYSVELVPTKMALDILSDKTQYNKLLQDAQLNRLETNLDLFFLVNYLLSKKDTRCIIMAAAVCDFSASKIKSVIGNESEIFGKERARLSSSQDYNLELTPSPKILPMIRQNRKDVFVVSFKTTAGVDRDETYRQGLLSLKKNSSNLVFANDIQEKRNMVITPEEFPYEYSSREEAIKSLAEITIKRLNLTFEDKTILKNDERAFPEELIKTDSIPHNWYEVMKYLFENKAFKPLPDTGKTSGHFGCRVLGKEYERITSERKINHNESFSRGMIPVYSYKNNELVVGGAKPSVGEKTQELIYQDLGDKIHAIIHFHCPLKSGDNLIIPVREQFPFECGSRECAINTASGMAEIEPGIYAVHLKNHGPNIAFHKDIVVQKIINFIERYWDLSDKTGGVVKAAPKLKDIV